MMGLPEMALKAEPVQGRVEGCVRRGDALLCSSAVASVMPGSSCGNELLLSMLLSGGGSN